MWDKIERKETQFESQDLHYSRIRKTLDRKEIR